MEGASTSSAPIHEESDEKAPIKGAVPEGESEPDAETKPESLTGEAPDRRFWRNRCRGG